jgi:hypothetical protein
MVAAAGGPVLLLCACSPAPRVGTFTPHLTNGTIRESTEDIIHDAKALGVDLERIHQMVGRPLNGDVAAFHAAGIETQLTIKTGPGTISQPLDTEAKQTAFGDDLGALLDQYRTPLLSVENEETADNFFAGTPDQYLTELDIAAWVARAHGVTITDGGIPWPPIALVTWNHLRQTKGTGIADAFLATVFRETGLAWIVQDLTGVTPADPDPYSHLSREALRVSWKDAEYLLAQFRSAPIDYVNFHWYVPDDVGGYRSTGSYSDVQALRGAIASIKGITGKQVVTNEVGQRGTTPGAVTGTLQVLVDETKAPFVLWFDADGIPAHGLHDAPGQLRPNGEVFAAKVTH